VWLERVQQIRDDLTDFISAYNLPHDLFAEIVKSVLRTATRQGGHPHLNPELAPWDMLFAKAEGSTRPIHSKSEPTSSITAGDHRRPDQRHDQRPLAFVASPRTFSPLRPQGDAPAAHRARQDRRQGRPACCWPTRSCSTPCRRARSSWRTPSPSRSHNLYRLGRFLRVSRIQPLHDYHNRNTNARRDRSGNIRGRSRLSPAGVSRTMWSPACATCWSRWGRPLVSYLLPVCSRITLAALFAGKYDSYSAPNQGRWRRT